MPEKVLLAIMIVMQLLFFPLIFRSILRNEKFRKHMLESRRCQLASLEAFRNGDTARADKYFAAAQAALERAEYFA